MSAYGRCPPTGGVRLQEVSVSGGSTVVKINVPEIKTGGTVSLYTPRATVLILAQN